MKGFILLVALVLAIAEVKSDHKEEMRKIDMACREVSHASEDDIKAFFKGEMKDEPKENLKCHMKCLMEKQGHWNNGAFDVAAAIKQIQDIPALKEYEIEVNKILNDCKNKKGTNECDTSYLITKCIVENYPVSM